MNNMIPRTEGGLPESFQLFTPLIFPIFSSSIILGFFFPFFFLYLWQERCGSFHIAATSWQKIRRVALQAACNTPSCRGLQPPKEGPRPRGATVRDATFGSCRRAEEPKVKTNFQPGNPRARSFGSAPKGSRPKGSCRVKMTKPPHNNSTSDRSPMT
jgi:hypothetical protein